MIEASKSKAMSWVFHVIYLVYLIGYWRSVRGPNFSSSFVKVFFFFFNQLLSLEKKEETFIKNFVILESQVFCQHFETVVDSKLCQIKIKIKIAKFAHYTNAARKRTIV